MSIADKGTVGLIPVTRVSCTTQTARTSRAIPHDSSSSAALQHLLPLVVSMVLSPANAATACLATLTRSRQWCTCMTVFQVCSLKAVTLELPLLAPTTTSSPNSPAALGQSVELDYSIEVLLPSSFYLHSCLHSCLHSNISFL